MAIVEITDVRPNGTSFAEGRLNPPTELLAPPLAPNGTTPDGYVLLREDAILPAMEDEDPFQPPQPSNLPETMFGRGKLVAGTAIIAALGIAGLTYFLLAPPAAKSSAETQSSPMAGQPSYKTSDQSAVNVPEPSSPAAQPALPTLPELARALPEPSPGASGAVPEPGIPAEASPQVAPSAATPNRELVFLQRPGVNIRSAPSGNASVLGTAPQGTQFTATSREGDWVQVENPRWKGWINSQFLAPNKPL